MKTTFDTDAILYSLLCDSPVNASITGGIYVGDDRPNDSDNEDVEVNSIDLTQEYLPQVGTSNINIYVPDIHIGINGKQQLKSNRVRLKELANTVLGVIRSAQITGLKMAVGSQTILAASDIKQHYVNIRIDWNIQTN